MTLRQQISRPEIAKKTWVPASAGMMRSVGGSAPRFGGLAVEMLFAGFGLSLGAPHHPVLVLRRRIEGVEPQRPVAGVDDVVARPGRHHHRKAVGDGAARPVDLDLARALVDAEEL